MKRFVISLIITLTALCSLSLSALAAEEITVQLDGHPLVFTDATPQIKENRIFLPYRAVFEAMGAEVGYEGNVVTAKRGSTSLSMTIGEPAATITHDGITAELPMDVVPYIDTTSWRTYVPVRFAADAFGCNVGWDQAEQTAIIVDVEKLVEASTVDKQFSLLNKFLSYTEIFKTDTWAIQGTVNAGISFSSTEPLPMFTSTVTGIVSDNSSEMKLVMDVDATDLMHHLSLSQDTISSGSKPEFSITKTAEIKRDSSTGKAYYKLDDVQSLSMGIPTDAWVASDLSTYPSDLGLEWNHLALAPKNMSRSLSDTLKELCLSISLNNRALDGYKMLADTVQSAAFSLSDAGFSKASLGHETVLTINSEEKELTAAITLKASSAGDIKGYEMDISVKTPDDQTTSPVLLVSNSPIEQLSRQMHVSMDQNNHLVGTLRI